VGKKNSYWTEQSLTNQMMQSQKQRQQKHLAVSQIAEVSIS